ncbi:bifunctional phosphoglucose/phosphomannose isomerase [Candidatus Wolfebacteria bacterium]|nr:bifunctional phosphoglucose/phosphomannose isomerase [Candidatus Wolfebacteria bacterium]
MEQSIRKFTSQFQFQPKIVNSGKLKPFKNIVIAGMGGSHLAADLLKMLIGEKMPVFIHKDYGLPNLPKEYWENNLIIISSYSGNTEEAIDSFSSALKKKFNLAVISTGGKLLKLAQKNNIPYVQLPDAGIQPRLALGFNLMALLKLIGLKNDAREIKKIRLNNDKCRREGERLAKFFENKIPIIYSSLKNEALTQIWKINFNETSKIPAFYNVFPELNHNEMEGFDAVLKTKQLSQNFRFLILTDKKDDKRILKRMKIFREIFIKKGFAVEILDFFGGSFWRKIFNNYLTAVWASYYLAKNYNNDPEKILLIENFKKMI